MKTIFLTLLMLLLPFEVFATTDSANEIRADLKQQVEKWNRGDIHSFVKSYNNSPNTLYVSSTLFRGYHSILKRYLTHYANKDEMGKLSYSILELKVLSPMYAMVVGKWHLERAKGGDLGGVFTLLYEKTAQGWKIDVDHTS